MSVMVGSGKKKVKGPEIPKDETLEETEARLADNPMKLCVFQVGPRILASTQGLSSPTSLLP